MKLYLGPNAGAYMLWTAVLDGEYDNGHEGVKVHHQWFTMASSGDQARAILQPAVAAACHSYRLVKRSINYRPMGTTELVICVRRPGGRFQEVILSDRGPGAFALVPALMDTSK